MAQAISVPRRFNGPLESGHGGYCSGVVARAIDGLAEVSLRRPVPLDTPLALARDGDGAARLLQGAELVAEGRALERLELEPPEPVGVEEARAAAARYRGRPDGVFSRCFVCGRAREDAFGVFAGELERRELVASPWTPPDWTAAGDGAVRPEFVWAALDCPTYFASYAGRELGTGVLARLAARIDAPIRAGEEHVVVAWALAVEGRKRHAGAAVLSPAGETLALASALLVEPRAS